MRPPLITVAMPCLNEAGFIQACIKSVQGQTYPRDRFEILVADGGSTDGTRDILIRMADEDHRIRKVENPDHYQAAGLNRILAEARGDIIVRMDVHCEYEPDYLQKCVEVLDSTGADNVGGAQRCRGRTDFEKAVCAALKSPLGVGGAAYRNPDNEGYVDTVFLGAYRRSVFDRIGPWDEGAVTNEDAELNQRLVAAGGRIYLSREIVVHYSPRGSVGALARQYYRYGRGRSRTLLKHRRFLSIRPAMPFLALCIGTLLIAALPLRLSIPLVLVPAFTVVLLEALRTGASGGVRRVALVAAILPAILLSHGLGFGVGLIRGLWTSSGLDRARP